MIKKTLMVTSLAAAYYMSAQDVSTIRNTIDVYSNSVTTGSAKYNSMAGSMGALGGEYSVISINPAAVGVSIANDFSATLGIESNQNTASFAGQSRNFKINNTELGSTGGIAVFPISSSPWKFVNVGVNYSNRSLEDYVESPGNANIVFLYEDDNQVTESIALARHAYNRLGNQNKTSIAVGGNYDNRLYFGAGLNFHNSYLEQYDTAEFTGTAPLNQFFTKQYTPFSESASGFSASLGVIGKVNPNFRLGAAIETPTWWTIERVFDEYSNLGDGRYYEDRKLSTPLKATLSAAYVANKNFSMNVDYSLGLTKPKYKVYTDTETSLNDFFSDNGTTLSEVKVGAEYRIQDFRLRAGYGFATNPFDSVSINSFAANGTAGNRTFDDIILGKRNTVGAGIGYDFRSFYIDAAYQFVSSDFENPFLYGSEADNTGYYSPIEPLYSTSFAVSDVEQKRNNFYITLGWKF